VMDQLRREGSLHPRFYVPPRAGFECEPSGQEKPAVKIPRLFRTYLRIGAKVCGPPAIDRQFGTIDYFVIMDVEELSPFSRRMFFGL